MLNDMTNFDARTIPWREPWHPIPPDLAAMFEAELRSEICNGHVLFGRSFAAIGRRRDRDDFLFYLGDKSPRFAAVHLTFQSERRQEWPKTLLSDSLESLM